ncbi:unnamed protein product [Lactuca virosa]|uniref:Uncharacterized protein n=1 Tax=Lactuca virosa TaxID=75947 RepID=A0AAU9P3C5_9ASTR|nr:unnamed protein product [Lactuca virosa]
MLLVHSIRRSKEKSEKDTTNGLKEVSDFAFAGTVSRLKPSCRGGLTTESFLPRRSPPSTGGFSLQFTSPVTVSTSSSSLFFSESTFSMEKKHISQTWVSIMYQRFEAAYQEDTVKYVENHIQTVGESMKKFYNGVMQDLILPPKTQTYTNSISSIKENTIDSSLIPTEKCHNSSPIEEQDANPNFENEDKISFQEGEEIVYSKNSESDDSVFEDANWGIEKIMNLNMEIEKKIEGEETLVNDELSECDSNTSSKMESLITCNNENKEEKENSYDSSTGDYFSASSYDVSSCESSTHNNDSTMFASSDFALSNETTHEVNDSMVEFEDLNMDTIDLTDKEQLVESCVIVEGEKVFSFPYGSGKSKSYKKIIQDAFMSRKKITKEYKQLAIWCGDIEKEFSQKTHENATKSEAQDSHESEWELL